MDVLNDLRVLQGIVEALGGCWSSIEPSARAVKTAVEEQRPTLSVEEVKKGMRSILDSNVDAGKSLDQLKTEINTQFRSASPWEAVKAAGQQALPPGEATRQFRELQSLCSSIGLWLVPVGELEGFCKSIGGHGPRWVQEVIEQHDLSLSPEIEGARNFCTRDMVKQTQDLHSAIVGNRLVELSSRVSHCHLSDILGLLRG